MAETVQQLVTDVVQEGGFDVADPQALRWLNRRWRLMVSEARAYRVTVDVDVTVAGEAFYAFSPVEAYSFEVAGVPYGKARRPDVYGYSQGALVWSGPAGTGLILADADATGVKGITLVPAPTTDGLPITSFAAMMPPDLTLDDEGDALLQAVLEDDFADELISGAVATGQMRSEARQDLAAGFEQVFSAGVERLRLRTRRRFRAGPGQIRILGVNA